MTRRCQRIGVDPQRVVLGGSGPIGCCVTGHGIRVVVSVDDGTANVRRFAKRDLHAAVGSLVTTELIVAGRFVHRLPAHDHVAHISAAFCAPAVPDRTVNRGWKWAASRQVASSMLSSSSPLPTSTTGWPSSVPIQNVYPRSRRTRSVCIAAVSAPEELQPSSARSSVISVARITTAMGETWATLVQSSVYGEANVFPARARRPNPGIGGCAGR